MDYQRIYNEFIKDRKAKEPEIYRGRTFAARNRLPSEIDGVFYERHHIVPAHLGRDDSAKNIVNLSAIDHLYAHYYYAMWKNTSEAWYSVKAMIDMPGSSKKRNILDDIDPVIYTEIRKQTANAAANKAKKQHKNGLSKLANSKTSRKKKSDTMKKRRAENPEQWENQRKVISSPEFIARRSATQKAKYASGEYDHIKKANKEKWLSNNPMNDPELKEKARKSLIATLSKPEQKESKRQRLLDNNPMTNHASRLKMKATKAANLENRLSIVAKRPVIYDGVTMSVRQVSLRERKKGNCFTVKQVTNRVNQHNVSFQESVDYFIRTTNAERNRLGNSKAVKNLDTGIIYESSKVAAIALGKSHNGAGEIGRSIKTGKLYAGYRWAYAS